MIIYFVLASVILTCFNVLSPSFVTDGLDPSWRAALLQARLLGLGFGNQVVFTGGPLSHVYTQTFSSQLFYENILATVLFAAFYTLFVINAASRSKSMLAAAIGAFPFLSNVADPFFLGLPFCASLIGTQRFHVRPLVAMGAAASAVATLAKFSVFPMAIFGFLIVDLIALSRRRLPIALIAYGFTLIALFLITSPNGSLPEYFRGNLEAAAGYSEAMSISGPVEELVLFLAVALTLLGSVALSEFRSGESPFVVAVGRIAIVGVFLLVCAKMGFVRHDGHALMAWTGLAVAICTYCASAWRTFSLRTSVAFVALTLVITACFVGRVSWMTEVPARTIVSSLVAERRVEYAHWINFISSPGRWLAEQRAREKASYEQIRAQHSWPQLEGTVDIIPSMQSALIANGLRYQPRPTLQEYTTYTRWLIEKNRSFFRGDQAPDFLLMESGSIDDRHPAFAEGPVWPDLIARYAPYDIVEGMVLLRKRDKPLDLGMHTVRSQSGTIDQPLDLTPLPQGAVFARIDVQPTFLGRLANLVFKSSILVMDVEYTDGAEASYRFIPSIAREGFFLSPQVAAGSAFMSFAVGGTELNPRKVKSIAIRPSTLAEWLWSETFTIKLEAMEEEALRANIQKKDMKPAAKQVFESFELFLVMMQNRDAHVTRLPQGVLAHAPTSLNVSTGGRRALSVSFGLLDGAWQGEGNTDGVCFRASTTSSRSLLWERCLDPKQVVADRGQQEAVIAVPDKTEAVVLETTCRKECSWDWSYWGRISAE
jgi:hypothetical protein